jgi:DNA-binding MarR family transcriptional regulator
MTDHLSPLEDQFLVLLLENSSIFPQYDRWDIISSELPPGKLIFWYAGKLHIGTKTLLKTIRRLDKKELIERQDCVRRRASVMRYILTKKGKEVATQIKTRCEDHCVKSPKDCYIKVLTKMHGSEGIEQPLFAIKQEQITPIKDVAIKKEFTENAEFVITRGDTLIVTIRKNHKKSDENEILVKGLGCDPKLFEKAKRYALVFLQQRGGYDVNRLSYKFISLASLPDSYLSQKIFFQKKTKNMLKDWRDHTLSQLQKEKD